MALHLWCSTVYSRSFTVRCCSHLRVAVRSQRWSEGKAGGVLVTWVSGNDLGILSSVNKVCCRFKVLQYSPPPCHYCLPLWVKLFRTMLGTPTSSVLLFGWTFLWLGEILQENCFQTGWSVSWAEEVEEEWGADSFCSNPPMALPTAARLNLHSELLHTDQIHKYPRGAAGNASVSVSSPSSAHVSSFLPLGDLLLFVVIQGFGVGLLYI